MSEILVVLLLAGSVGVAAWPVLIILRRRGLKGVLNGFQTLGLVGVIRTAWISIFMIVMGAFILVLTIGLYGDWISYQGAPMCSSGSPTPNCRLLVSAQVRDVSTSTSKSGQETTIQFSGGLGSATFYSSDVPPSAVSAGHTVTVEVWHAKVTAIELDGLMHESFATQSSAWIGIVAGVALLLLGGVILLGAAASAEKPTSTSTGFASPSGRRKTLYVLLATFTLGSVAFAIAGAFAAANNLDVANGIFIAVFLDYVIDLLIFPVFITWFLRAYRNLAPLGRSPRRSGWFVLAALTVPPLNLIMPYRLMNELVAKSGSEVPRWWLPAWWASALSWPILFVGGGSVGSANAQPGVQLFSEMAAIADAVPAIVVSMLTVALMRAVDGAQLALAPQPEHSTTVPTAPAAVAPAAHGYVRAMGHDELEQALRNPLFDTGTVHYSKEAYLRQLRKVLPAVAIGLGILLLQVFTYHSALLGAAVAGMVILMCASSYLSYVNVTFFSGDAYFGRTDLLRRRHVYPLEDLDRVVFVPVSTSSRSDLRLVFVGRGRNVLFQASALVWDRNEIDHYLERIGMQPKLVQAPVSYRLVKRFVRDGRI